MHLDHLGIATGDFDATADLLTDLVGAPLVDEEEHEGLRIGFIELDGGDLEVFEPTTDDGPVARFLAERGPGLHHVALHVEALPAALEQARALGIELIDEEPRPGARGHRVAFLHPRSTGGVLVEFVSATR